MGPTEMRALIEEHLRAEAAGDTASAVAVYTDDVEHDVVGWPTGPVRGPDAAKAFYDQLVQILGDQELETTRELFGEDFCVVEHDCAATVNGDFMGLPGNGRRVTFRMLHVWEFADGRMRRENVWLDGGSIAAQLSAPA